MKDVTNTQQPLNTNDILMKLLQETTKIDTKMNYLEQNFNLYKSESKEEIAIISGKIEGLESSLNKRLKILEDSRNRILGIAVTVSVLFPIIISLIEGATGVKI